MASVCIIGSKLTTHYVDYSARDYYYCMWTACDKTRIRLFTIYEHMQTFRRTRMINDNNRAFRFLMLSILGTIIALAGDIIIGYAAPGPVGTYGMVQVGWADVALWRPTLSMIMASIAFPLYMPGIYVVAKRIEETIPWAGKAFLVTGFAAITGGLMIHASFCIPQYIYKYVCDAGYPDLAVKLTDRILEIAVPSALFASLAMLVGFVILFVVILQGKTIYKRWTVLFTPVIIAPATTLVAYIFSDSAFFAAFGMCKMNLGLFLFFILAANEERKRISYPK